MLIDAEMNPGPLNINCDVQSDAPMSIQLGTNAAGYRLKLFYVFHRGHPHSLRHVNRDTLPVKFAKYRGINLTQEGFEEWILTYF